MNSVRWQQRLRNFEAALIQLQDAINIASQRSLSNLEKQGLIQAFEFTHELAWKVIKDYFEYQGRVGITGSRDAAREAFGAGLVSDGEAWMEMILSRNQTSHTYNQALADEICRRIVGSYGKQFEQLRQKMNSLVK